MKLSDTESRGTSGIKMHKRGQRGRGRPPRKRPASERHSTLSIGNCRVELPTSLVVSIDTGGLSVNVPEFGNIHVKVANDTPLLPEEISVTLLNPKSLDATAKLLLEDVLKLYVEELPAMKFAAGTGKKSKFLQSCVFGGKYCTMVLRGSKSELVGAITYQILPSEPSAEVPLAAIAQSYHRKGFGSSLYKELQRRLFDVGIISIFCWGDEESLAFWAKQGFIVVGEVDGRGRARKLPIKAETHRAMSIPGSATLMISYLSLPSTTIANFHDQFRTVENNCLGSSFPPISASPVSPRERGQAVGDQKESPHIDVTTPPADGECKPHQDSSITLAVLDSSRTSKLSYSSVTPLNMERILSDVASESQLGASKSNAQSESQSQPPSLLKRVNNGPASVPAPAALKDITNIAASEPDGLIRPLKKRRIIGIPPAETCKRSNDETPAVIHKSPMPDVSKCAAINASDGSDKPDSPTTALPNRNGFGPTLRSGLQVLPSEVQGDLARGGKPRQEKTLTPAEPTEVKSRARLGCGRRGRRKRLRETPISRKEVAEQPRVPGGDAGAESSAEPNVSASSPGDQQQASDNSPKGSGTLAESSTTFMESLQPSSLQKSAEQIRIERAHRFFDPLVEQDSGDLESRMLSGMNLANIPAISDPHVEQALGEVNLDISQKQGEVQPLPGCAHFKNGDHSSRSEEAHVSDGLPLQTIKDDATPAAQSHSKTKPVIMFMNMADENQKKQLTQRVEALQGEVTSDGRRCTHMVLREVRRTHNFCVAISSGAWIVSPDWLKISVKQNRFADESRFIPRDKKFEVKYKVSLQEVIFRAKQRPNALFESMSFYATPHVQPPPETISSMVKAAGGQILRSLDEAITAEKKSNVAVVACEEDMSEAIIAARAGLQTFNADWLLTSVVKQQLDLSATQFSMSL